MVTVEKNIFLEQKVDTDNNSMTFIADLLSWVSIGISIYFDADIDMFWEQSS